MNEVFLIPRKWGCRGGAAESNRKLIKAKEVAKEKGGKSCCLDVHIIDPLIWWSNCVYIHLLLLCEMETS